MIPVRARGTRGPRLPFESMSIERRDPGPRDIVIDIAFAGMCHSDIEHAWSLRGRPIYPLVPGHEIACIVSAVGSKVTRFAPGDRAGVGNMVASCRDGQPTYGGYSQKIAADEAFAVRIPAALPLLNAAPLLCAGITMYSPLRHWCAGPGERVAIIGFGGLGHVGVQIARAMGAHVAVLDLAADKRGDALQATKDRHFLRVRRGTGPGEAPLAGVQPDRRRRPRVGRC